MEAMVTALKEVGLGETEIKERLEAANLLFPNTLASQQIVPKPGATERDLIEGMKKSFHNFEALTGREKRQVAEIVIDEAAKTAKGN